LQPILAVAPPNQGHYFSTGCHDPLVCDSNLFGRWAILISRYSKRWKSHKEIVAMSMALLTVAAKTCVHLPALVDLLGPRSITGSACERGEREVKNCGPHDQLSFEREKGLLFLRRTRCITPVIALIPVVIFHP
jgi:hypothetical protein